MLCQHSINMNLQRARQARSPTIHLSQYCLLPSFDRKMTAQNILKVCVLSSATAHTNQKQRSFPTALAWRYKTSSQGDQYSEEVFEFQKAEDWKLSSHKNTFR